MQEEDVVCIILRSIIIRCTITIRSTICITCIISCHTEEATLGRPDRLSAMMTMDLRRRF